jgi:hypothetical protein
MSGCRLRYFRTGLRLYRMNKIWELDRILDEEDRDIVAHDI